MSALERKRIVLGVSGSIAAYKAIYLLRLLTQGGAEVTPVLTRGAQRFVGAMSFSALAGRRAICDLWSAAEAGEVGHVETAHWAELMVIAPASADTIARIALGRADDPLAAIALSTSAPLLVAPAMEDTMWHSPATQSHIETLRNRGAALVAPESGALASGRDGSGRLADPEQIAEACVAMLTPDTLKGKKVVVSAGPTREHSDPVRFLSNPSSGKMGFALAEQAVSRGAQVTLVAGPVALEAPHGVTRIDVTGTEEMLEAMRQCTAGADLVVMAAAPADYRPAQPSAHKVKKGDGDLTLTLTRTPDILKSLDLRARGTLVIGFAAETRDLKAYARKKLQDKNLDAVVGNIVGHAGTGFGAQNNAGRLFFRDGGELELPLGTKGEMAARILDWAQERL